MVYNELEIYRFDENSETWVGPDVLFSSPRPLGFDHTTVFDTFWGDDVTFDGENCFENLCQSIGHNCNDNEKCVQSWNYYETDTHNIGNVVECCDGSDCRKIVDPIKTTESPTTFTQSTVTTSTASTASDICDCTSDVISNIGIFLGSLRLMSTHVYIIYIKLNGCWDKFYKKPCCLKIYIYSYIYIKYI